jgi:hypothetical protein
VDHHRLSRWQFCLGDPVLLAVDADTDALAELGRRRDAAAILPDVASVIRPRGDLA